jgi:Ion channel
MIALVEALEMIGGLALMASVLWDVFQTVVVPRPTPARYRIARLLTRGTWPLWRAVARRSRPGRREYFLGTFAPTLVLVLLAVWIVGLTTGFGLLFHALRGDIRPSPTLGESIYLAGASVLTIGYGDFVPTSPVTRTLGLLAGGFGLGVLALTITYLFSLYGAFQRREALVTTLDARAGAPPSGVALLETYARHGMLDDLRRTFAAWEMWSVEVLDSHLAYPILAYFRSSHDNESWVSALGAVLDAATLVGTTMADGPRGQAKMTAKAGSHLVEDLSRFFRFSLASDPGVERFEFEEARRKLGAAGLPLGDDPDAAWHAFAEARAAYAAPLNEMARFWETPPAQWIGDRSLLHGRVRTAGAERIWGRADRG